MSSDELLLQHNLLPKPSRRNFLKSAAALAMAGPALACAPQGNECRQCVVYRLGTMCTEDMKHLLHDPDECRSTHAVVSELLQRIKLANGKKP